MKINGKIYLIPFLILLMFSSCKELLEPSINKRVVTLQAPGNNYQSTNYTISFWWDKVGDALNYQLQIVSPKFDSISTLTVDTLVKFNKFTFNLSPGQYQWRVKAFNGSSETSFSQVQNFTVAATSIKQQSVQLGLPGNNTLTNQNPISFKWSALYGATNYRLQIDTANFTDTTKILYNQLLPGLSVNFKFPKDQRYQWRVRAENDTARARWSAINIVSYDHTPPEQVTLTAPGNAKIVSLPLSLQWNNVATANRYKLYVFKADSVSNYNASYPTVLTTNSYTFNLGVSGDRVYWRVSALDAAGNEGKLSIMQSFVLQ